MPSAEQILATLIQLYADQNNLEITYELEGAEQ